MQLNTLRLRIFLCAGLLLLLCGCTRAAEVSAPETPTAVPSLTATPIASPTIEPTVTRTPLPSPSPKPTATPTFQPPSPLLPAPLYFLSPDDSGIDQVWRMEMDGGISHPVTAVSESVTGYDVSKWDGSLAYISGNDLYVLRPGTEVAEMILDGEELDPEEDWGTIFDKTISSPVWSTDGKEIAYSLQGVRVLNIETGIVRVLLRNNTDNLEDVLDVRAYSPVYWSPSGDSIAVRVYYYEHGGLVIISADEGQLKNEERYGCCYFDFSSDTESIYLASTGWEGLGFYRILWETGIGERLDTFQSQQVYDFAIVVEDTVFFLLNYEFDPKIAKAEITDLQEIEIVDNFIQDKDWSGRILWASDASRLIATDQKMKDTLRVWFPGKGYLDLDRPGKDMKWGQS